MVRVSGHNDQIKFLFLIVEAILFAGLLGEDPVEIVPTATQRLERNRVFRGSRPRAVVRYDIGHAPSVKRYPQRTVTLADRWHKSE